MLHKPVERDVFRVPASIYRYPPPFIITVITYNFSKIKYRVTACQSQRNLLYYKRKSDLHFTKILHKPRQRHELDLF